MSTEENTRRVEDVTLVMATGGEDSGIEQNPKTASLDECPENIDNEDFGSPNNEKKTDSIKEGEPFVEVGSCDSQTSDTGGEEEPYSMLNDVNNAASQMNTEEGNQKDGNVVNPDEQHFGKEQTESVDGDFTFVYKHDTEEVERNKTEEDCLIDSEAKKQDGNVVNNENSPVLADAHVPSQESEVNCDELNDTAEQENQTKTENPARLNVDVKNGEENQSNQCQSMSSCTEDTKKPSLKSKLQLENQNELASDTGAREEEKGDKTCMSMKPISEQNIVPSDTEEIEQKEGCERVLESERHSKNTEMTATDIEEKMHAQVVVEMPGSNQEISPMDIDETEENLNVTDTRTNCSMNEHSFETDENTDRDMLMGGSKAKEANSGVGTCKSVFDTKAVTGNTDLLHFTTSNIANETLHSTSKQGQPDISILSGDNMNSLKNIESTTNHTYTERGERKNNDDIGSNGTESGNIPASKEKGTVTLGEAGVIFEQPSSDKNTNVKLTGDWNTGNNIGTDEDKRQSARAILKCANTNDDDKYDENPKEWDFWKEKDKATEKFVFFWKRYDVYSQWHSSTFYLDNQKFSCAEQYMMYKKAELFQDEKMMKKILNCKDPRKIKQFGRKVKHFEEGFWRATCLYYVKDGNKAKFSQNAIMKSYLIATHPKVLVEASPMDPIWGIGLDEDSPGAWKVDTWEGLNLLGYILTEVRDEIMAEEGIIPDGNRMVYLEELTANYCAGLSGCYAQETDHHDEAVSKEEDGRKSAMETNEGATSHTNKQQDKSTPPTAMKKADNKKEAKKNKNKQNLANRSLKDDADKFSDNFDQDAGCFGNWSKHRKTKKGKTNVTAVSSTKDSAIGRENVKVSKQMQIETSFIDKTDSKKDVNINVANCDNDVEEGDSCPSDDKTCVSDKPDTNISDDASKATKIVDEEPDMVTGNSSNNMNKSTNSEYENQAADNNNIDSEASEADMTKNENSNHHDTDKPDTNISDDASKASQIDNKEPGTVTENSSDDMNKQRGTENENQTVDKSNIDSQVLEADVTKTEDSHSQDTETSAHVSNKLPEDQNTELEMAEAGTDTQDDRGDTPKTHSKSDKLKSLFALE